MKAYLVVLTGQGDTDIKLCTKEVFDWITGDKTTGKPENKNSWIDQDVPQCVLDSMENDPCCEEDIYVCDNTLSNDRALNVGEAVITVNGEQASFYGIYEAIKFIRENDIEIVDVYEGYVY